MNVYKNRLYLAILSIILTVSEPAVNPTRIDKLLRQLYLILHSDEENS